MFATLRPALTDLVAAAPAGRRVVPPWRVRSGRAACVRGAGARDRSASTTAPGASTRPRTRSARRSRTATCGSRPATARTTSSRSGRRCTRPGTASTPTGSPTRLHAHAARRGAVARDQRVAEPDLGEPRRAQPPVLGALVRTAAARRSRRFGDVELDAFMRAINRAEPGLIRVDADETTYSLHIILRFELEQELIEGTVALEDLPEIVERPDEGVPRHRRPGRRARRAPGRALVGRRDRLLPDLRARQRDLAADLGEGASTRSPTSTSSSRQETCCRCRTGCATTSTRSGGSSPRRRRSSASPGSAGDRPGAVPRVPRRQDRRARPRDRLAARRAGARRDPGGIRRHRAGGRRHARARAEATPVTLLAAGGREIDSNAADPRRRRGRVRALRPGVPRRHGARRAGTVATTTIGARSRLSRDAGRLRADDARPRDRRRGAPRARWLSPPSLERLDALERDVTIDVFVTPT